MTENVVVKVRSPKPHCNKQALLMQAFHMEGVTELYVACGTKFGKTAGASVGMATAALAKKRGRWRWIAPIYEQAKLGMDYFDPILPPPPHTKISRSGMKIELPYINGEIKFWHTKDPVSLEGAGIHGNLHDEAAKQPYEAVVSARTTTTFTKGLNAYVSTPYGKNWFYHGCMRAKEEMEWALKKGVPPTKIFITARTMDNPYVDPQIIKNAKAELSDRMFRQYYRAEFVDDGTVFTNVRQCVRGPEVDVFGDTQYCVIDDAKSREVVVSVDWAKKNDYTVMGAFDYRKDKPEMVGFYRFKDLSYVDAVKELHMFCQKFGKVGMIYHDRTGVGEAIDDLMGHLPYTYEGITFSSSTKASLINQLMLTFEKNDIVLLNWPEMLKELDAYEVVVSQLGTAKYSAPSGMHDDIVIMMALGNAALEEYRGVGSNIMMLEDLPEKKLRTIDSWYRDMIEEDEEDRAGYEQQSKTHPAFLFKGDF